mmetsp:Transcript_10869/g.35794  ORF Transcript_10869/g.35794 Transcript_10869/m.35794 type:complete len:318 (+) Transcript_10869:44-997(+)
MVDVGLIVYLTAWYLGNYYYNIFNKTAAKAGGGSEYAMIMAWIQMAVGAVYALALWILPEARKAPAITFTQVMKLAPVGFFTAAAHAGAVFSLSAGAVSFAQVIKAAEPAFAAAIGYAVYGSSVSRAKLLMLVPVIGGICIASASELDFTWACLAAAGGANVAAAFRGQENKKAMAGDMKAAIGGGANAYAIGTLWSTLLLIPTVFITGEWQKMDAFLKVWEDDGLPGHTGFRFNLIMSGLTFYLYNEVSTLALGKISGVTHSVANTAKRAIIIVGCAIAFGESMSPSKMAGCSIAIGGTFLYAVADDILPQKKKSA